MFRKPCAALAALCLPVAAACARERLVPSLEPSWETAAPSAPAASRAWDPQPLPDWMSAPSVVADAGSAGGVQLKVPPRRGIEPWSAKPYGFGDLFRGVGTDQRDFWSWPCHCRRSDMRTVLPIIGGLGVAFAIDNPTSDAVARSLSHGDIMTSRDVADAADVGFSYALPILTWGIGRLAHRPYMAETGGLMAQALLSSGIEVKAIKGVTGRMRPFETESGEFTGPEGGFLNKLDSRGDSFPSGHTSSAFAVATVLAGRTQHRWVRWAAFGTAGFIGATRITGEKHFPADVLAGATLGWAQGRITLRNRHLAEQRAKLLQQATEAGPAPLP